MIVFKLKSWAWRSVQYLGLGKQVLHLRRNIVQALSSPIAVRSRSRPRHTGPSTEFTKRVSEDAVPLVWWSDSGKPNFGDALSPVITSRISGHECRWVNPLDRNSAPHVVGLGSISHFAQAQSILVGTGALNKNHPINPKATCVSLRGPRTAEILESLGGEKVSRFGDPGMLVPLAFQDLAYPNRASGTLFVRHRSERAIAVRLPEGWQEANVEISEEADVRHLISRIIASELVVTSAMHVFVTCQAYGVPVSLVRVSGASGKVYRDEMKFEDYALGAKLPVITPIQINPVVDKRMVQRISTCHKIGDTAIADTKAAVLEAVSILQELVGKR